MHPTSESSALGVSRLTHVPCMQISLWDMTLGSSLSQWFFNGGVSCRVLTPHARIPRELGLSLLVTGVWLKNHLSLSIFTVEVPRHEASMPCLCAAPFTVTPTREHKETLSCLAVLPGIPPSGSHHVDFGQRPRPVNA